MSVYKIGDSSPKSIHDLLNILRSIGYRITEIPEHGKILRFPVDGDKSGERSGWISAWYTGDLIYANYGDWRSNDRYTWHSKQDLTINDRVNLSKLKEQAEAQREKLHKEALTIAHDIIAGASPASPDNAYLTQKNIHPCGALSAGGTIILPLIDMDGNLQSIQYIKPVPGGKFVKLFLAEAKRKGSFYRIDGNDELYICEGFSTGATIHEATGGTVYCALSASNVVDVAEAVQAYGRRAVICADNDFRKPDNAGLTFGRKAAGATGFHLVYPEFDIDEQGTDFNDYGIERTKKMLSGLGGNQEANQEKTTQAPKSKAIITYRDFGLPAPLDYLIESKDGLVGYLPAQAVGMIFGPSTAGKSFVALDMALCIATGRMWHGNDTRRSRVLFIVGEGQEGFKLRIHAWLHYHDVDPSELDGWFAISTRAFLLDDIHHISALASAIKEADFHPEVMFIDTLATNMKGDENQSGAASMVMRALEAFRQDPEYLVKHICLIHHTPKGAPNDARGSTVFKANADYQINVYQKMGARIISSAKNKDGMAWDDIHFGLVQVPISEGVNWMGKNVKIVSAIVAVQPSAEVELPEITPEQEEARLRLIGKDAAEMAWKNFTRDYGRDVYHEWDDVKEQVVTSYRAISQTQDPPSKVLEYLTRGKNPIAIDHGPANDPSQPSRRLWRLRHPLNPLFSDSGK